MLEHESGLLCVCGRKTSLTAEVIPTQVQMFKSSHVAQFHRNAPCPNAGGVDEKRFDLIAHAIGHPWNISFMPVRVIGQHHLANQQRDSLQTCHGSTKCLNPDIAVDSCTHN